MITVTLLAFLVVLLIGLAAYSRIETAIAGNVQRQTQARQNALLGLNVALGQLQKFAGPDQRVTATADSFGGAAGTRHFTGVWDTTQAPSTTPATWLVSGNEYQNGATSVTPTTAFSTTDSIELVGAHTTGATRDVVAKLQPVTTVGAPGVTGANNTVIGRYAWWVGDQGVKAPVATADATPLVNYAPWDSAELRSRLRQQVALGAGAADASGNAVFESRDAANTPLVSNQKVAAYNQLSFLKNSAGAQLGLTPLKTYFHAWSPNNFAVLANTKLGGLRQDLSLDPTLLGSAFAAWANYDPANGGYMEDLMAPASPAPTPALASDPLRRRYVMTPHLIAGNGSHQVAPVITYLLVSFNVRTVNNSTAANAPLEVRARWMVTLWNPYASALVPEDLQLDISGLPSSVQIVNDNPVRLGQVAGAFSLTSSTTFGAPLQITLPWASASLVSGGPPEDRTSWLPGRVYTWRSAENTTRASPPSDGYASDFYSRTLDDGGQGVIRTLGGLTIADGGDECHLNVSGSANLALTLYAARATGRVRLAGCTSPDFVTSFVTNKQGANQSGWQFSYVFRLAESLDTPTAPGTWLTTDGRDLRRRTLPAECYVVAENGNDPGQYGDNYKKISSPDRLLDRAADSFTYNEDVPVYELPRGPILSLGVAQHFRIVGRRPFMIGNSWGMDSAAPFQLNGVNASELFDRFYFSGLVTGVAPSTVGSSLLLPNPQMKVLPRSATTGDAITLADLQGAPTAQSSKYLLQGAAFNVNSTNPLAWAAVLRTTRFPAPQSFTYLDADAATGTAADDATAIVPSSGDAQFFRFPHGAGETYKAESGQAAGGAVASAANTDLFRKGMRTLASAQVTALANAIATAIAARHAAIGPFLSLEEFLGPPTPGSPSLLEQAILDAKINESIAEFSSQWLTQGDILTTLAPVLFPRSDTFVIRAYGQAVNPATGATEGHAWCEATVQRVPEYFDKANDVEEVAPAALTSALNQTFGRRFKIVSFRWLTRSDI